MPFYLIGISCICFLAALLLVPLSLVIQVEYPGPHQVPQAQGDLRFFAGLFGLRIRYTACYSELLLHIFGWTFSLQRRPSVPAKSPLQPSPVSTSKQEQSSIAAKQTLRSRKARPKAGLSYDRFVFWAEVVGPATWVFVLRLPNIWRLKYLDLTGSFGFTNPAQTGYAYGYLQALLPLLDRRCTLNLNPDFTTARLDGRLRLAIQLYIGYFVYLLCRFVVQAGYRWLRATWSKRRARQEASA